MIIVIICKWSTPSPNKGLYGFLVPNAAMFIGEVIGLYHSCIAELIHPLVGS